MVGSTISHYKIVSELGRGGMGVVYKARDTHLDRDIALKFLPPHHSSDRDAKSRFIQEAKAASSLDHPNICTIFDIDETSDGHLFIAMAYYEGPTLDDLLSKGAIGVDRAVDIATQIASALALTHNSGIVHRDIKPANVMVANDGTVKLLDFGLAKLSDVTHITVAGSTVGTAAYMSPEQARGDKVDHRTDIWSLGVVLYEMLSGERPFRGEYETAVVYSILNTDPKKLSAIQADLPEALVAIVDRAIVKSPSERYGKISDILVELRLLRKELDSPGLKDHLFTTKPKPSIAVLPFRDMSQKTDQQYFCDGMAEEIINALTHVESLRVVARTSSFSFRDKEIDIREIGKKLNVETVLEGSVRTAGIRLRITAQLINVADGYYLWSEKYDRDTEDIFQIQDEISLAIVDKLKVRLLGEEKAAIVKRHTEDLEVYHLYLKGRYYWNKRYKGGLQEAMECFKQAIEKLPEHALSYSGLADSYNLLGFFTYLSPQEAFPKAKMFAQKALGIDYTLAEAHTSLGLVRFVYDWDWLDAEREFKRAFELRPSYALAHLWYAFVLMMLGRTEESIKEIKQAQELDPLSLMINSTVGWMLYFARQYDLAIDQCLNVLSMDPNFGQAHIYLGWAYEQKGMYEKAIEEWQRAKSLLGIPTIGLLLAQTYAMSGDTYEAQTMLNEMNELSKQRYFSSYHKSAIYAGLGEKDKVFEWLEKAYNERDGWLTLLKVDPRFDTLRSDPRLTELLKKVGLEN